MKLAEALSIRKDLQKRIQQLEQRIKSNVKVQEDDEPLEDPNEQLSKQIDDYSGRLRKLDIEIQSLNFLTELA
jgi:vacuolar-type H+-ATPase subunit E/Vma4